MAEELRKMKAKQQRENRLKLLEEHGAEMLLAQIVFDFVEDDSGLVLHVLRDSDYAVSKEWAEKFGCGAGGWLVQCRQQRANRMLWFPSDEFHELFVVKNGGQKTGDWYEVARK